MIELLQLGKLHGYATGHGIGSRDGSCDVSAVRYLMTAEQLDAACGTH